MPQNFIQRLLGQGSPQQVDPYFEYEEEPLPDYGEVPQPSEEIRAHSGWTGVRAIDFIPNSIREMGIVPKSQGPILMVPPSERRELQANAFGNYDRDTGNIRIRTVDPEFSGRGASNWTEQNYVPGTAQHEVGHYLWNQTLTDGIREQWTFLWNQHKDRLKRDGWGPIPGWEDPEEAYVETLARMGAGVLPEHIPSYFGKFVHASLPGVDLRGMHDELFEGLSDHHTLTPGYETLDREGEYQTMFDRIANTPPSQYDVSPTVRPPSLKVDPYHAGPALSAEGGALRESDYRAEQSIFPLHNVSRWNSIDNGPQGQELYNISQAKLKALGLPETPDSGWSAWRNWGIGKRFTREEAIANAMAYAQTAARQMHKIQNEQ